MKKIEYARILVNSPVWNGIKDANKLVKIYSKEQLKDACEALEEAEEEYYNR